MKVMLLAFVAVGVIAIGASYALQEIGFSSQDRNAGSSVRLDAN